MSNSYTRLIYPYYPEQVSRRFFLIHFIHNIATLQKIYSIEWFHRHCRLQSSVSKHNKYTIVLFVLVHIVYVDISAHVTWICVENTVAWKWHRQLSASAFVDIDVGGASIIIIYSVVNILCKIGMQNTASRIKPA